MVELLTSGFYTTIQDLGRYGYQHLGVPISGAMDLYSSKLANLLIGNNETAAVMEMTASGSTLLFHVNTIICITGADMSPLINGTSIKNNTTINVNSGDILSFGKLKFGFRSYMAVFGGFISESVMNSKSMYLNVTTKNTLSKGDLIKIMGSDKQHSPLNASIKIEPSHITEETIEVFKCAEFELLSQEQQSLLFTKEFSISKSNNRMAYQLNEILANNIESIITSLVLPGTVQLTPSGSFIILMRDCQTTGGYPRILQLKETSINILAQKTTHSKFRFKLIE